MGSEEKDVLRVRGCLITKEGFAEVEVSSEKDLETIARRHDLPIIECDKEGYAAVIDVGRKLIYKYRRPSGCEKHELRFVLKGSALRYSIVAEK